MRNLLVRTPSVRLLLSGRLYAEVKEGAATLFALGSWRELPPGSLVAAMARNNLGTICEQFLIDGSAVLVSRSDDLLRVGLYRGLTSGYDLYYRLPPKTGQLVVADTFRGILSTVPVSDRSVPTHALIDALLFRTVPGENSLIASVSRLGHGQSVEYELTRPDSVTLMGKRTSRLDHVAHPKTDGDDLTTGILKGLAEVAGQLKLARSDCNLFSGGVDSTLLQALAKEMRPLHVTIDSPEYQCETDYARAAAQMLNVVPEVVTLAESEYLCGLEEVITASALPPHHMQTVLLDAAFREVRGGRCVSGQFGDGIFGFEAQRRYAMIVKASRLLGPCSLALRLPQSSERSGLLRRIRSAARLRDSLAASATDPGGLSALVASFTDLEFMYRLFGRESVDERLVARVEYALERVPSDPSASPVEQRELVQWVDFYCEDTGSIWRQIAAARSTPFVTVYNASDLVRFAKSIPVSARYAHGGQAKYLLKGALKAILPAYPVDQPKYSSGLPLGRYMASGPLAGTLGAYPTPSFLSKQDSRYVAMAGGPMAWNVLTLSMWDSLVNADSRVEPIPGTRLAEWGV